MICLVLKVDNGQIKNWETPQIKKWDPTNKYYVKMLKAIKENDFKYLNNNFIVSTTSN